jgi:hypothetical protein
MSGQLLEGIEGVEEYRTEHKRVFGDPVNHPAHYNQAGIEVIDVIDTYVEHPESYYHGNVIKYVLRAIHKGNRREDWEKAYWYLGRLISTWKKKEEANATDILGEQGHSSGDS